MEVYAACGPPVFISLAAWIGFKPQRRRAEDQPDFENLMRALAPGGAG